MKNFHSVLSIASEIFKIHDTINESIMINMSR